MSEPVRQCGQLLHDRVHGVGGLVRLQVHGMDQEPTALAVGATIADGRIAKPTAAQCPGTVPKGQEAFKILIGAPSRNARAFSTLSR